MRSDKTRRIVIKPRLLIGSPPILTALLLLPLLRTSTCEEYHILPGDTGKYFRTFERDIKLSIKFETVGYDRSFSRGCIRKRMLKKLRTHDAYRKTQRENFQISFSATQFVRPDRHRDELT